MTIEFRLPKTFVGTINVSNLINHAINELKSIGMYGTDDEMSQMMSQSVLDLLEVFSKQGHSGHSAPYCIKLFKTLAEFKPLSPLSGKDEEWNDVSDHTGGNLYQNKRCSSVFKDGDRAYNVDGKVFWEWFRDKDGTVSKTYYSCKESFIPVTFPYTIPEKPIYEYRWSPSPEYSEKQTEEGFV